MQDINLNQKKLKINDTYKRNEEITANFEPSSDEAAIDKAYLDRNLSKIEGPFFAEGYIEFKLLCNKQSVQEVLIQKAVKMTMQILYDKVLFDNYNHANDVIKNFLFVVRRRLDLEEVTDIIH